MVYIGVLLRRQARYLISKADGISTTQEISNAEDSVARGDRIALSFLLLLIAPSLISLPVPQGTVNIPSRLYTEPFISALITLIGYYSVWSALRIYSGKRKLLWLMAAILIIYAGFEVAFTYTHLRDLKPPCVSAGSTSPLTADATNQPSQIKSPSASANSTSPCPADYWRNGITNMRPEFLIAFAASKLLFSLLFIYLVLDKSLSDEDRRLKPHDKLLKLIWN